MWHVNRDMGHMVGGEQSLKIPPPQLLRFGMDSVLKILNDRTQLIIELLTKVFVEQPRLHRVC